MVDGELSGDRAHGLMILETGPDDLELEGLGIGARVQGMHGLSPRIAIRRPGEFLLRPLFGGQIRTVGNFA